MAVAVQAALPLLVAAWLAAYAVPEVAPLFDASLCLHDATGEPAHKAPPHDCNLAACPLCAVLAASHAPMLTGAIAALPVPSAAGEALLLPPHDEDFLAPLSHPYRSRAPPHV